ncbi:MAG: DUF354 domain-containing protein, partial [Chitinophagaceae bacterium]|nr:DUF354 domain-containing protein [Chitinophagaceae bacterium]
FYENILSQYNNVITVRNDTYNLLRKADAALVTSGTATLETALFKVPQVVCYKGNAISYQIAKRLIKVKYISLVNLIMDTPVVKELIQNELNIENLERELTALLNDNAHLAQLSKDYDALREKLTAGGSASANAAKIIFDFVSK